VFRNATERIRIKNMDLVGSDLRQQLVTLSNNFTSDAPNVVWVDLEKTPLTSNQTFSVLQSMNSSRNLELFRFLYLNRASNFDSDATAEQLALLIDRGTAMYEIDIRHQLGSRKIRVDLK